MAVVLTRDSKVLVQGATGAQGAFHLGQMLEFGTRIVAGVTPGKGGESVQGVPVFDTVDAAVRATGADTSCVFVPAAFAKDAVLEALDAGLRTVVVITEHIPVHDAMDFVHYAKYKRAVVIGPNGPGAASPGEKAKVGILPNMILRPGDVAIASRSGTLTYEIVSALSEAGLGQSTCLGLGGDAIPGTTFVEALELFEADPQTQRIVLVGEIGGTAEERAAEYAAKHVSKPVFAYVAGRTAPEGKRMGHAGAIVDRGMGTAESKRKAFEKAGIALARFPTDIPDLIGRSGKK